MILQLGFLSLLALGLTPKVNNAITIDTNYQYMYLTNDLFDDSYYADSKTYIGQVWLNDCQSNIFRSQWNDITNISSTKFDCSIDFYKTTQGLSIEIYNDDEQELIKTINASSFEEYSDEYYYFSCDIFTQWFRLEYTVPSDFFYQHVGFTNVPFYNLSDLYVFDDYKLSVNVNQMYNYLNNGYTYLHYALNTNEFIVYNYFSNVHHAKRLFVDYSEGAVNQFGFEWYGATPNDYTNYVGNWYKYNSETRFVFDDFYGRYFACAVDSVYSWTSFAWICQNLCNPINDIYSVELLHSDSYVINNEFSEELYLSMILNVEFKPYYYKDSIWSMTYGSRIGVTFNDDVLKVTQFLPSGGTFVFQHGGYASALAYGTEFSDETNNYNVEMSNVHPSDIDGWSSFVGDSAKLPRVQTIAQTFTPFAKAYGTQVNFENLKLNYIAPKVNLPHGYSTFNGDYNLGDLLFTVADVPVMYLKSLFNFDLFGINLFAAFCSLMTLVIVAFVLKKVM